MSTPAEIGEQACPSCGYVVELASGIYTKATPKPGDLCVCLKCGALQMFDDELHLRLASGPEVASLDPQTRALLDRTISLIKSKRHLPS